MTDTALTWPVLPSSEPTKPLVGLDELVWLHAVALREFGGAEGIRDPGLLDSALARPVAGFGGTPLFRGPLERAGALMEGLIQNHGFVDANKRTAMMAGGLWLEREGLRLEAKPGELVDVALSIAQHRARAVEIALWLEPRCVAVELSRSQGLRRSTRVRESDLERGGLER